MLTSDVMVASSQVRFGYLSKRRWLGILCKVGPKRNWLDPSVLPIGLGLRAIFHDLDVVRCFKCHLK